MENLLGKRLKRLRENSKKTQKEFAKIFGLTNYQLSRYESGQSNPDPDLIVKFADYFEVTTDYLHGRTDDEKSIISIAFEDGGDSLTEDEEQHLEEELRRYRELKERFMREKNRDNS